MDILNKYVGHFKDTAYKEGNICLAAHNRGYEKNYFAKLHTLNIGEKIIYNIGNNKYYYSVVSFKEVSEDDVSCLYDNPEDVLILITCIKNKPTKRLVVTCKKINS